MEPASTFAEARKAQSAPLVRRLLSLRLPRKAHTVAIGAVCTAALVIYGSFGRPIWIDEFLQFALGSHRSLGEAWDTISATTVATNHGQTGFYMLLDYGLLRLFGANAVALRLPSVLSGALLLVSASSIVRQRGFGLGWQLLALAALLAQTILMYFVGEARPYMPLAAASVGTLAYYLAPAESRAQWGTSALGIVSVLLGALVHPYFSVYAVALFGFAYLLAVAEGRLVLGWSSLLRHVNVPLTAAAAVAYLALGSVTWMRRGPSFELEPFQWIAGDGLYRTFVHSHLEFADDGRNAVLALILASIFSFPLLRRRWRDLLRPLLAPAVLLLASLGLSLLLSYLSYRRHYWVLPRQWVASMALAPIAVVWWWAEAARVLGRAHRALAAVVPICGLLLVGVHFKAVARNAREAFARFGGATPPASSLAEPREAPGDNDGWVEAANRNIQAGGPVWDVFRKYYGK